MDLALNSDFSVHLDDRNDLGVVEGREAFEQSIAVYLQSFLYEAHQNSLQQDTIIQKVRLEVTRVAREHGELTGIEQINVERHPEHPDRLLVDVEYTTNRNFELEVTG